MKTETSALLNAPPWSPIRGRIVGRREAEAVAYAVAAWNRRAGEETK